MTGGDGVHSITSPYLRPESRTSVPN